LKKQRFTGNANLYPVNKIYQIDKKKMINNNEKYPEKVDLDQLTVIF